MKSINYYVHDVESENLEKTIWNDCFDDNTLCRKLCQELGWQGGTIHQVIDEIRNIQQVKIKYQIK